MSESATANRGRTAGEKAIRDEYLPPVDSAGRAGLGSRSQTAGVVMRLRRRRLLQLAGATVLVAAARARAETYPARAVRLIVPFGPASGADIAARLFADRLSARWRQPVVVENRPGAAGRGASGAVM
jgi:hypothetical protein